MKVCINSVGGHDDCKSPDIDRTWYGENFDFDIMPADFWLSKVSGVPFGVVNELLPHRSVNKGRRGMVYAMVLRLAWLTCKFRDEFGITESKLPGSDDND